MNIYLKIVSKIEFVLTNACTGRCRHCSAGDSPAAAEYMDPYVAANAVRAIAKDYDVKTVMTFGGEPLLNRDAVYAIISTATELGIPHRQLITNGYFSNDKEFISDVAKKLALSGINDLLLSVDAFHQETIPLDTVKAFAEAVRDNGIPIRLSPAWLVSREHNNPYNIQTRKILDAFIDMNIPVGNGNIVFPEGNALKYLSEYFLDGAPENPYVEDPYNIRCISFSADGDVLGGNIKRQSIKEILESYAP